MKLTVEEYLARRRGGFKRKRGARQNVRMVDACARIDRATGFQSLIAPIMIESLSNVHVFWTTMHKLKKKQEYNLAILLRTQLDVDLARDHLPLEIQLWRLAPNKLDPGNLEAAHKAVQDAVARWIGHDDGDREAYTWSYEQRSVGPRTYGFELVLQPQSEGK